MKLFESKQYSSQIESVLSMLDEKSKGCKINVDPLYQRNVVWRDDEQSYFIDSIMKGIAPMPILFCKSEKKLEKVCMDGKQRLSSLKNFYEDKIGWKEDEDDEEKFFGDLTNEQKMRFLTSQVYLIEYGNISYEDQMDIFSRIQHGKPLSEGEKIIALFKDIGDGEKFKILCDDVLKPILNTNFSCIKGERQEHRQFIVQLMCLIENGINLVFSKKNIKNMLNSANNNEIQKKVEKLILNICKNNLIFNDKIDNKILSNRLLIILYGLYQNYNAANYKKECDTIINNINIFLEKAKKEDIKQGKSSDNMKKLYSIWCNDLNHNNSDQELKNKKDVNPKQDLKNKKITKQNLKNKNKKVDDSDSDNDSEPEVKNKNKKVDNSDSDSDSDSEPEVKNKKDDSDSDSDSEPELKNKNKKVDDSDSDSDSEPELKNKNKKADDSDSDSDSEPELKNKNKKVDDSDSDSDSEPELKNKNKKADDSDSDSNSEQELKNKNKKADDSDSDSDSEQELKNKNKKVNDSDSDSDSEQELKNKKVKKNKNKK
jgi:hypothetical protein